MTEQIYYDDVEPGQALPPLVRGPLRLKELVMFGAATNDYSEIHYDEAVCRDRALPGPLIHGPLKAALIARMLTDWIGPDGEVKKLSCRYSRMDVAGDTITCKGRVKSKLVKDGLHLVECEVAAENGKGEVAVHGTAIVSLPAKRCLS